MPKIADFTHIYQGLLGTPGACRIRVYRLESGMTVVIASELPGNAPRASITNVAEALATQIRGLFVVAGGAMVWIEHYPGSKETFDRVLFQWAGLRGAGVAVVESPPGRGTDRGGAGNVTGGA